MILGQEIYDSNGRMLLGKHTELTEENIAYIAFLGMPGVYVDDEFSEEIQIQEIIEPEVYKAAVQIVHRVFVYSVEPGADREEEELRQKVTEIVKAALAQKDVLYNLIHIKSYDGYTYFHSVNVAILSAVLGAKLHLSEEELMDLTTAGFLHDVGKVFIDTDIINAPRKLTPEERAMMMDHPRLGYDFLVTDYHFDEDVVQAVYQHHEWYNGQGYPRRLSGKDISMLARIIKVADVYDAMTGRRSYHEPYLPSDVLEYIMGRNGMEFDPEVVQLMSTELCVYPIGCEVQLSDGRHGVVLENHRGTIMRPTIKLLDSEEKLNLTDDRSTWNLTITKLMM
ncbi:HD-GYP domain, c-di-GMP phosphodiesterase class II (or its inactivated variant) [Lachnospiraceae bacterium C10]|jgi:HD-GYP domain-containing protein (c-di-GMP phosphodiesterase class II)|nr:HD-GYP domain, c-di-GMP phosphodiesterase class II (or its inactivated variant) [Lachnospiraceae bacterium C10]SDW12731.1 HD-GYP domain, c-di-GMP phosphodiesterase class II (or its inactivated variant) [Lachnospiraceae bacterium KHCPX20]